ncbi:MAG: hypothetical protein AAF380_01250 [Bacteroidota bacterium]
MYINLKKIYNKKLLAILLLVPIATASYYIHQRYTKEYYTVNVQNIGDVLSNPLEFQEPLKLMAKSTDTKLSHAAQKILDIDKQYKPSQKVNSLFQSTHFQQILDACYTTLPVSAYSLINEMYTFFHVHQEMQIGDLFNRKFGSSVDRALRELGGTRLSPLHYNGPIVSFLTKEKKLDPNTFTQKWIASIEPYLQDLFQMDRKKGKEKEFLSNLLVTFMYDYYTTLRFYKHQATQELLHIINHGSKNALGNALASAQLHVHQLKGTDIIMLQEAPSLVVNNLLKKGYFIAKDDRRDLKKSNSMGAVILYSNRKFSPEQVTTLSIPKEGLDKYKNEVKAFKNLRKLTMEDKLSINLVKKGKQIWLVASFHADSNGDNTLVGLQVIQALRKHIEETYHTKVLLLVGMDGNTTNSLHTKIKKRNLDEVKTLTTQLNLQLVLPHIATVSKTRTFYQPQKNKANIPYTGISDFGLLSTHMSLKNDTHSFKIVIDQVHLGPAGPNALNNPSDHKRIAFTFYLKKARK